MLVKLILTGVFAYATLVNYDAGNVFWAVGCGIFTLAFLCTLVRQ